MKAEWYINVAGKPQGLFTTDQVISLIRTGEIKRGSLVWKTGLISWEPVEVHFTIADLPVVEQRAQIAPQDTTSTYADPNTYEKPKYLNLAFLSAVASITLFFFVKSTADTTEDTSTLTLNWYGTLIFSVVCSCYCLALMWKYANLLWRHNAHQLKGGALKLFCIFGAAVLLVYFAVFGYAGTTSIQITKARSAYNKYSIEVDPASNLLTISGLIGPNFANRVKDKLKVHPDIRAIIIDSPGGLIDEGLSAAKYIESLSSSTVIAQGTCNSSCLLVLMSAKNRLSNWNMNLGFHAASAITSIGEAGENTVSDLAEESYSYLIRRGVPTKIIQQVKLKGASKLELVSAIDMLDSGALTGLVDGNKVIDANNAKWKFLEDSFNETEYANLADMFLAIQESDQLLVKKYAAPLYQAINSGDGDRSKSLMAELTSSIVNRSVKAAEGSALNSYVASQFFQIRHLIKLEQWKACVNYANGDVSGEMSALSKEIRAEEFNSLANLIRSASANMWKSQPIPSWVDKTSATIYEEVALKAIEKGLIDDKGNPRNEKGQCIYTYLLFDKLLDLDADTSAPVLRSLLTQ